MLSTILPQYPIRVEAKRIGNFVEALITPLTSASGEWNSPQDGSEKRG
jgi:hypothetical protein